MQRSTTIFISALVILTGLLGYNYFARPFANLNLQDQSNQDITPSPPPTPTPALSEAQAHQELASLIAAPFDLSAAASSQAAALAWIAASQPGVVTLFGEQVSTTAAQVAIDQIQAQLPAEQPALIVVDHEGGQVQRLSGDGFTTLPSWQSVCASSAENRQQLLTAAAKELVAVGVDLVLAPVVDTASYSAVLTNRICGHDPQTVVARASEVIDIFQRQNLLPVLKHYPGAGGIKVDLHRQFDQVTVTENDIMVFKQLLEKYPQLGVMTTHIGLENYYPDVPCSLNEACVGDLLEFFPDSLVISDALDMAAAGHDVGHDVPLSLAKRAIRAIEAGNNLLLFGPEVTLEQLDEVLTQLVTKFNADTSFQEQVEASRAKIQQYQQQLNP